MRYLVSMGVYVLEPRVLDLVPRNVRLDLPELVVRLLDAGEPVHGYRHDGYWLDIGRPDDYERAQEDVGRIRGTLLDPGPAG
jgi:NDP-sugar pyrophosphorylase family protein